MTDFEYQKTLLIGAIIGACIAILAFYMMKPEAPQSVADKSNFAVVDTYKECDVIKYTVFTEARSHYFLDCSQ